MLTYKGAGNLISRPPQSSFTTEYLCDPAPPNLRP
jgi:hypothetical protein